MLHRASASELIQSSPRLATLPVVDYSCAPAERLREIRATLRQFALIGTDIWLETNAPSNGRFLTARRPRNNSIVEIGGISCLQI